MFEKAPSRWANVAMVEPRVVAGNFALSFSLKVSIFVYISSSIERITLIWVSLETSFPNADGEHR